MSAVSYDLDFAAYRSLDAVSRSTLATLLSKSPAHARYELDHPKEQTPDMILGTALHCRVLEPDVFSARFACRSLDGRTKEGKAEAAQIEANGQIALNRSDWAACLGMAAAVGQRRHPELKTEVTLQWEDRGVKCKARLDEYIPGIIWDLKSTQDARPKEFSRTLFYQGYHLQGAFYLRGAAACGLKAREFRFITVERDPPHGVYIYRLDNAVLQMADAQIDRALDIWAECLRTGVYPSYPDAVTDISLPPYALKELEEQS